MSQKHQPSRRTFLKGSSAAVAGAALAGGLNLARSVHAAGNSQPIRAAVIGCGGRGTGAGANLLNVAGEDIKIIAVADAFEKKAQDCVTKLQKQYHEKIDVGNRVFHGFDCYKQALEVEGVNYVILAAPPGFRPMHYAAAVAAGKNIFMEKPCCVDAPGYRAAVEANKQADAKGLKVGVGLQRHHSADYQETVKRLKDGAIGDILFFRAYWNGGAIWIRRREPGDTEMQYQMRNWYHFVWLSGDNIVEQHVHNLDVCNWIKGGHPVEANGMGGCEVRYTKDNKGVGQIFDHHAVEFTYADGTKMFSQCRQIPGCWNQVAEAAHGVKGESNCSSWIKGASEWKFDGKKTNPYDQEHVDLIKAIREGTPYNEGHFGAESSFTAVLGRMAVYSGQVVKWDDAVAKGLDEMPKTYAWDAQPPAVPNAEGNYPIPVPGVYKPFAKA